MGDGKENCQKNAGVSHALLRIMVSSDRRGGRRVDPILAQAPVPI
jgi:hypothetical protein